MMHKTELKDWMVERLLPRAIDNLPTLQCDSCSDTLQIGDSIQYETTGYTAYCDNTECTEGVATYGTCLEDCWWGGEKDFWSIWDEVIKDKGEKNASDRI